MVSAEVDEAERHLLLSPSPRWALDDEPHDVTVEVGSSDSVAFLRSMAVPGRVPVGASFASTAVAIWEFLDRELHLGFGPVLACRPSEDADGRR